MTNIKPTAKNLEDVREMNLSMVIKLLQKMKVCSRAEIAKASGLRQSTITNIINELIECGLVEETGNIEGCKGRRSIGITLKGENFKVLAIRLSRKCFMVGCFDINGTEYDVTIRAVNQDQSVEEVTVEMEAIAADIINRTSGTILAIGIAVPGPVILSEERIALVTGKIGWKNIRFRERFQQRFGIPVYIEHDANAGALAEWWFGHNRMERGTHMYVAAGQGIGAGITLDGKVLHGSLGVAGEIGHMSINCNGPRCQCGNRGCLELYASVSAMIRRINDGIARGEITSLRVDSTVHQVARAMGMGDPLAVKAFDETAGFLGFGLSQMINLYNPDVIVIGDEFTVMGEKLLEIVRETVREYTLPELFDNLEIRFTSFERDPALIGAAALAVEKVLKKPTAILVK